MQRLLNIISVLVFCSSLALGQSVVPAPHGGTGLSLAPSDSNQLLLTHGTAPMRKLIGLHDSTFFLGSDLSWHKLSGGGGGSDTIISRDTVYSYHFDTTRSYDTTTAITRDTVVHKDTTFSASDTLTIIHRDSLFSFDTTSIITRDTTHSRDTVLLTLPDTSGRSSQFLQTKDGTLQWATPAGIGGSYAFTQTDTTGNPTDSIIPARVMYGAASLITPTATGKLLVIISGAVQNTQLAGGVEYQIAYGTGTPPINGSVPVGTLVGTAKQYVSSTHQIVPFSIQSKIEGLTPNVTYWIDLQFAAIGAASASLNTITITSEELP